MEQNEHPLVPFLQASVTLRIMGLKERGGPDSLDWSFAREFAGVLSEKGDTLLFGGKKGEAAELANSLARAIAILSFLPGGITLFGETWGGENHE